jgi:hypothetical protein
MLAAEAAIDAVIRGGLRRDEHAVTRRNVCLLYVAAQTVALPPPEVRNLSH